MIDDNKTPGVGEPRPGPEPARPAPEATRPDAPDAAAHTEPNAGAHADPQASAKAEPAVLSARNAELEGQIKDLTDRLLRAHADLDNLRKRLEREKEETAKYAITRFAQAVVGVADNFERAIGSVPAAAVAEGGPLKALLDGVSMTEREFLNVLEKHGVKRISPQGEAFNPHQHQAVMEAQDPSVPAGTVTQVFQAGYMIEERCLRPAMVVVAKGGPKPGKPAEAWSKSPSDISGGDAGAADGGQSTG